MAKILELPTHKSSSGELTVVEKLIPGEIKRVFYIHDTNAQEFRGGHSHKESTHILICLHGSCHVTVKNELQEQNFVLDNPYTGLLLEPTDWRMMHNFTDGSILLVISNQYFDEDDYIYTPE